MKFPNKRRFVFLNLHGNEFLVKTANKYLFGQSCAVKHRYLLDYLLEREDIEVCTYITPRGLSLSYTTRNPLLQSFRFLEHKWVMRKNGIKRGSIKVLTSPEQLSPSDILICYSYYGSTQLCFNSAPDCIRIICQIHFNTVYSAIEEKFRPHAMYNEADLHKYSGMWNRDLPWFDNEFITIPFVFEPRFQSVKPFDKRKTKAVSVGTITYMHNITDFYGDPCAQPARRNCRLLGKERPDLIDSFNFDYNETNVEHKAIHLPKTLSRLYNKFNGGHQKQYYSFNMVDKLNDYKIAVVGEEVMGIPGIGFVEAMACGCAFIGQKVGYYEDYGMQEGVHYIGYDGTKEDLAKTIEFWMQPENQTKLKEIASAGHEYVKNCFNKETVARKLVDKLLQIRP